MSSPIPYEAMVSTLSVTCNSPAFNAQRREPFDDPSATSWGPVLVSGRRHDASASSRALASFRSSVSKPSANQP